MYIYSFYKNQKIIHTRKILIFTFSPFFPSCFVAPHMIAASQGHHESQVVAQNKYQLDMPQHSIPKTFRMGFFLSNLYYKSWSPHHPLRSFWRLRHLIEVLRLLRQGLGLVRQQASVVMILQPPLWLLVVLRPLLFRRVFRVSWQGIKTLWWYCCQSKHG